MFSAARAAPLTRSGPRPLPIVASVLAHAVILSLVHFSPRLAIPPKPRSLYDAVIRPHEHELVWYSFSHKLPEVAPRENQSSKPAGTELISPDQTIVSNPKLAGRGAQMIWRPAPQIKPQLEIVSPNILAFQRPLLPPPPPSPPPKLFVPPAPVHKPPAPPPVLPAPPPVTARVGLRTTNILLADLSIAAPAPKPRDFVPPVPRPEKRTAPVALPEAPSLATSLRSNRVPLLAENMAAPLGDKPQPRQFVPPPTQGHPAASPAALPDAPKVAALLASANVAANHVIQGAVATQLASRPETPKFVLPQADRGKAGAGTSPAPIMEAPSLDLSAMPSASVNVAIVGLTPAPKLNGPLPDSSRDARFSAGPSADASTGPPGSASQSMLSVPGLLVRGDSSQKMTDPLLLARAAPTSRAMLEAAMKSAVIAPHADPARAGQPPAEIRLAPPPDSEFNGRDVYSLAVQMPNISSYVGSWIMWFADRERIPRGSHGLRPPVPLHKVDPKYLPAAVSERIEGKVQITGVIRTNGHVDLLRILKGVDPRLDRSAEDALLKWEFAPAERNGVPVEVDLVAEIPFLLAPQAKR